MQPDSPHRSFRLHPLSAGELLRATARDGLVLEGTRGDDLLEGSIGPDRLEGGAGDDHLHGWRADDRLGGGSGHDRYRFERGDGADRIDEAGGEDTLVFGPGIAPEDLRLTRTREGDLHIDYGAGDSVLVAGHYTRAELAVERIELAGGAFLDAAALAALPVAPVLGGEGADRLDGSPGPDTLRGLGGDNRLDGAAGDDLLEGGDGHDTYVVRRGMGRDRIVDDGGSLLLEGGLEAADLTVGRAGEDLVLGLRGGADRLTVAGYHAAPGGWLAIPPDGGSIALSELLAQAAADAPFAAAWRDYRGQIETRLAGIPSGPSGPMPTHRGFTATWSVFVSIQNLYAQVPVPLLPGTFGPGTSQSGSGYPNPNPNPNHTLPTVPVGEIRTTSTRLTGLDAWGWGAALVPGASLVGVPWFPEERDFQVTRLRRELDDAVIAPGALPTVERTHAPWHVQVVPVDTHALRPKTQPGEALMLADPFWQPIASIAPGRATGSSLYEGTVDLVTHRETAVIEEIVAGDSDNHIDLRQSPLSGSLAYRDGYTAFVAAGGGNDDLRVGSADWVDAGAGDDRIEGGYRVAGGAGNDVIVSGGYAEGGDGDDVVHGGQRAAGGAGNDIVEGHEASGGEGDDQVSGAVIDGGAGSDRLTGWDGATRFRIDRAAAGHDELSDPGSDADRYFQWFCDTSGIPDVWERVEYGGHWNFKEDSQWQYFNAADPEEMAELQRLLARNDFTEAEAIARDQLRWVIPIDVFPPEVSATDYPALDRLVEAGAFAPDIVEFGPGLRPEDLRLVKEQRGSGAGLTDETLVLDWGADHRLRVALARPGDPLGTGVERFRFADGTLVGIGELLARATPRRLDPEDWRFEPGRGEILLPAGTTRFAFGAGIAPADLRVGRAGTTLVIAHANGADRLIVEGWFGADGSTPQLQANFEDGARWEAAFLSAAALQVAGTAGDDTLAGLDAFGDTLAGGPGNDRLAGGGGDDTYRYHLGDGVDRIDDLATAGGGNTLQFGPGITPDLLSLGLGSLVIRVGTGGEAVHLEAFDRADPLGGARSVERFVFADGRELGYEALLARGFDFGGGAGNDRLAGLGGADRLEGGPGSDELQGGAGDDTLLASADGTWGFWSWARNAGSPGRPGTGETVNVAGKVKSLDRFDGGDGYDELLGSAAADGIFLDDRYSALPGGYAPRLSGIEAIRAGEGNDVVDLTSARWDYGDVLIDGGAGHDVLWSAGGSDRLQGGAGGDRLDGGAGRDLLEGGAGNDRLAGGAGDDILAGGAGDDWLQAGAGDDLVLFNAGDGRDTLRWGRAPGALAVSVGGGVQREALALCRSGSDLALEISAGGDRITFQGWFTRPADRPRLALQLVEGDAGAAQVDRYDLTRLADGFAAARRAAPALDRWALMDALLDAHLAGSDAEVLGGEAALRYGLEESLAGLSAGGAADLLSAPRLGTRPQPLAVFAGLEPRPG